MADRLISMAAVMALIDNRVAAVHRLQTNPLTKSFERKTLEGVVNAMQRLQDEVRELPSEEYTEDDIARMFNEAAANDVLAPSRGVRA